MAHNTRFDEGCLKAVFAACGYSLLNHHHALAGQRTLEHLHEKYAEGGYLHLLIPGSPNEQPLERLRAIIRDETRLRSIFEAVFEQES